MRTIPTILFLLATLPMIITGFLHVDAGAYMDSTTKSIDHDIAETEERKKPYSDALDVTGHLDRYSRLSDGYLSLIHPQGMDDYRLISITRTAQLEDFLEKGEAMPSKEFIKALASSRAIKVAERECQLLQKHLVKDCRVRWASAQLGERGRLVRLSADYYFTQKMDVGTYNKEVPLRFVSLRERFNNKSGVRDSERAEIYQKVADMCTALRRIEGNCAVSNLRVVTGFTQRGTSTTLKYGALQRR